MPHLLPWISLATLLCLGASATPLCAQFMIGRPASGQWVDGHFVQFELATGTTLRVDDHQKPVERIPPPAPPSFPLKGSPSERLGQMAATPGSTFKPGFQIQGAWYTLEVHQDPSRREYTLTFWRREDGTWQALGRQVRPYRHGIPLVLPYGRNTFLFLTKAPLPREGSGPWSPFQVHRVDPMGTFQFDSALPTQLQGIPDEALANEVFFAKYAFAQDHLVYLLRPGFLYTFDLAKGRTGLFRHLYEAESGGSYPKDTPTFPLATDLLPTPEGTVYVAGRAREAAREWPREAQELETARRMSLEGVEHPLEDARDLLLKKHPALLWWELDPAKGRLRALDAPPLGGKARLDGLKDLLAPTRVRSDGSLHVGPEAPPAPKPAPSTPTPIQAPAAPSRKG